MLQSPTLMTPTRAMVALGITVASSFALRAQQSNAAFDVASIHPAAPQPGAEGSSRSRIQHSPTSITMRNIDLNECIQWSYDVPHFQITGRTPRNITTSGPRQAAQW